MPTVHPATRTSTPISGHAIELKRDGVTGSRTLSILALRRRRAGAGFDALPESGGQPVKSRQHVIERQVESCRGTARIIAMRRLVPNAICTP